LQHDATSNIQSGTSKTRQVGTSSKLQGYRPTPFDELGMRLHSPAMARIPAVPDFTDISNIGVALLSCITANAIIKVKATKCSSGKLAMNAINPATELNIVFDSEVLSRKGP
jgi:hypothetical protein